MSSIHEAASRGDLEELSRLLSQDPGLVHHRDRRFHDCTPLCQAVIRGQLQAVQLLIDHGADVNAGVTRRGGGTVLVQACAHGNRDVALLLLARGADPVKDDSSRAGALKAAAYGGDEEIVRALLRSGVCDVDGCSGNGRSALWKACCHGHQGAARALLTEGGADPGVCDKDGKTPKDIATERGHHGCVQLLQWFEGELERAVLLAKARRLAEDVPAIQQAPGRAGANLTAQQVQRARCRAAPPYLRRRVETGDMEMPSMQVLSGGAGQQEGEEEEGSAVSSSGTRTREVLRWVVEGMRDDPWADLMHLLGPTTHGHANTISSSSRTTTGR